MHTVHLNHQFCMGSPQCGMGCHMQYIFWRQPSPKRTGSARTQQKCNQSYPSTAITYVLLQQAWGAQSLWTLPSSPYSEAHTLDGQRPPVPRRNGLARVTISPRCGKMVLSRKRGRYSININGTFYRTSKFKNNALYLCLSHAGMGQRSWHFLLK